MAFFWGRFDPIEGNVDEELKYLYRRRELDDEFKNRAALVAYLTPTQNSNLDNKKVGAGYIINEVPNDAKYQSMTEEERLENGLPTKYLVYSSSLYAALASCVWMGFAMLWYSRIYYPGGVVLRRQRVEKPLSYLKKRVPIVALSLYTFYNMFFYQLKYNIDYRSNDEEEIDRQYSKIKKMAV